MSNFYQYPPQQPSSSSGPYGGGNPVSYPYGQPPANNQNYPPQQGTSANFPTKFPGEELLGLQNVSPDVLKFGISAGQNMLKQQTDRFLPGFSSFWLSLKYYFSVSNSYVLKKLLLIVYPISNKVWNRLSAEEFERGEVSPSPQQQTDSGVASKWALPKNDINAPDLYIPLMSFITYVLLFGFLKGVSSPSSAAFSPDILTQAVWRCLILQFIEAGGLKFGANILSIHVPFLDCYSFAGYKYVALCLNTIARFIHGPFSIVISLYTSCMLAYFVLKTSAIAIPPNPNESNATTASPRLLIILGFGVAQLVLTLFMSLF